MGQTGGTESILPPISGKPGKSRGSLTMNLTTSGLGKTTGFKNNTKRVKKNMIMAAVSADGFPPGSNGCKTDLTEDSLFFLSGFFII